MATATVARARPKGGVVDAGAFEGFDATDFAVFELPTFAARMPALRSHVKPKLTAIGEELTAPLAALLGTPVFAHVAQHLRRTVNPPPETWVAFSPSARAYKPFVHYRVAVSETKVRITVFVEDECEDKQGIATRLAARATKLAKLFAAHPEVRSYDILDRKGAAAAGKAVTSTALRTFAERLGRVKAQHAVFGIEFPKDDPVLRSGPDFLTAALSAIQTLKPLYDCRE